MGIELVIGVTDLSTHDIVYMSYWTHPNLSVLSAVRMSCAVPLVISPIHIGKSMFVDGCLTESMGVSYLTYPNSIGCIVSAWKPVQIDCIVSYLYNILGCVFKKTIPIFDDHSNVVQVDCRGNSMFDFDSDTTTRKAMFDKGYDATEEKLRVFQRTHGISVRKESRSKSM